MNKEVKAPDKETIMIIEDLVFMYMRKRDLPLGDRYRKTLERAYWLANTSGAGAYSRALWIDVEKVIDLREVEIGSNQYTQVFAIDDPGQGGACHDYTVLATGYPEGVSGKLGSFATVNFQNGPIGEKGVNGCTQEDLLAIVIDRLRHFQVGAFACRENALALTRIEEALHWLNHRTADRLNRGVEGQNTI